MSDLLSKIEPGRTVFYDVGVSLGDFISWSDGVKEANGGPWFIEARYDGKRMTRTCATWGGARCALGILSRKGIRHVTYTLLRNRDGSVTSR